MGLREQLQQDRTEKRGEEHTGQDGGLAPGLDK